jgi:AraC-like DNA-binding protein
MNPLIRAAALTNFLEVARSLGYNPTGALRRAGLSASMLNDPEHRIPVNAVMTLLEDAAAESGCPTFGLRMAESRQLSHFGAVSLLISHQPTLRNALITTINYRHLLNQSLAMEIEDAGKMVILREEIVAAAPSHQSIELAIGVLFRMCAALMGMRWQPRSVNFTHAAPADLRVHQRVFTCRVEFDGDFNGIVIPAADLDAANPSADPVMARYAAQFIESMPPSREHSIELEVRRAVYLMLPTGRATTESVAQGLGLSVRSMQRQLDEAGVSFTSLLNDVRRELAPRYLANPRYSLQRASELLGYSTQGSFTRWFCAQFNRNPSDWRARQGTKDSS